MPNDNGHCPSCAGSPIFQLAYLLLSKDELALEHIKMNEHLAKVLKGEHGEHSLMDFKGFWSDWAGTSKHSLPEPCVTQKDTACPRKEQGQGSPPAPAGLSVPVFLLWNGLCQQHPQSAQVLEHRLMLSEGRGSFAFSLLSA